MSISQHFACNFLEKPRFKKFRKIKVKQNWERFADVWLRSIKHPPNSVFSPKQNFNLKILFWAKFILINFLLNFLWNKNPQWIEFQLKTIKNVQEQALYISISKNLQKIAEVLRFEQRIFWLHLMDSIKGTFEL